MKFSLNSFASEWSCTASKSRVIRSKWLISAQATEFMLCRTRLISLITDIIIQQDPVMKHVWQADAIAAHTIDTYWIANVIVYPIGFLQSNGSLEWKWFTFQFGINYKSHELSDWNMKEFQLTTLDVIVQMPFHLNQIHETYKNWTKTLATLHMWVTLRP